MEHYLLGLGLVILYILFVRQISSSLENEYLNYALGWFLHVFWDINLHMHNHVDFVPHIIKNFNLHLLTSDEFTRKIYLIEI